MQFGGHLLVISWFYFLLQFGSLVASQVLPLSESNFSVPVAIRSPYFNAWIKANSPMNSFETFWNGQTNAWLGHVRVDVQLFQWVGAAPINATNFTGVQVTPTRTIFFLQAGPMNLTATFLTPIEPEDPVKQSLPFSYLSFEAISNDGAGHDVQVYTDISAEWVSANGSNIVTWNTTQTAGSMYHTITQQISHPYTEFNDQAEDVIVYYATNSSPSLTSQIGSNSLSPRIQFDDQGFLTDSLAPGSGTIANPFPVFGLSIDLGTITQTASPVVWALGVVRNPSIQYTTPDNQVQNRSPYFASRGFNTDQIIDSILNDFTAASQRADALDKKILDAASTITSDPSYASLVSLATRQVWGAVDLTISVGTDGEWNTSDVKMFMKDVGTSRRVNAVETLYAAFPTFLYVNATYAGYLLDPLLEYQDSSFYDKPYAARDLGESYPLAPGNNAAHLQGIEQSGNMLIMALAHARISGDGTLISRHYNRLKGWADYLVSYTLTPSDQENADLERQANLTNLAIKGIIGIKAMAEISQALHIVNDSTHYENIAANYANQWQSMALSADHTHLVADYGDEGSWMLAYNLFADRLLQTQLVSDGVYQIITQYYKGLISTSLAVPFGLPIDSLQNPSANSAWIMLTAAVTTDPAVRDSFIDSIWTRTSTNNNSTFPLQYRIDNGISTGLSSPAQGAMLAPLSLTIANMTITVPSGGGNSNNGGGGAVNNNTSIVGPVVGGVIGGLALIILIILGFFFWRRRSRNQFVKPGSCDNYEPQKFTTFPSDAEHDHTEIGSSTQVDQAGQLVMSVSPRSQNALPLVVVPSSKAREAMMSIAQTEASNRDQYAGPSVSTSSYSGNSNSSSRDPPTTVPVRTENTTEATGQTDMRAWLRAEIDDLRRTVLEIVHVERMEAPPTYDG
ncbi:hypothetical protein C8Q75DRAFT_749208 [Abortiporus biennis]|nr:hypothetical protein C8Q75DRAFT_749208 [Abortiporus biennis]